MRGTRVIVFDFDGVVVRLSELIKKGAWAFVANHPDIGDRVGVAVAEKIGKNRYEILRSVFVGLGKSEDQMKILVPKHVKRYNDIVQEGIRSLGVAPEDRKALCDLSKKYPLYVNSATEERAMNETVNALDLPRYFRGVYGQPSNKEQNFTRIMMQEDVVPSQILFIGDSDSDWEAAKKFGCHFLGLANSWNDWAQHQKPFPLIFNLSEIQNYLR